MLLRVYSTRAPLINKVPLGVFGQSVCTVYAQSLIGAFAFEFISNLLNMWDVSVIYSGCPSNSCLYCTTILLPHVCILLLYCNTTILRLHGRTCATTHVYTASIMLYYHHMCVYYYCTTILLCYYYMAGRVLLHSHSPKWQPCNRCLPSQSEVLCMSSKVAASE